LLLRQIRFQLQTKCPKASSPCRIFLFFRILLYRRDCAQLILFIRSCPASSLAFMCAERLLLGGDSISRPSCDGHSLSSRKKRHLTWKVVREEQHPGEAPSTTRRRGRFHALALRGFASLSEFILQPLATMWRFCTDRCFDITCQRLSFKREQSHHTRSF
jgi:hypothetical protein